jgi:hypothetical protein
LEDALGLLLLAVYITAILSISAAVTFGVIKIFPTERTPKKRDGADGPSSSRGVESSTGRLFRRAKREAS